VAVSRFFCYTEPMAKRGHWINRQKSSSKKTKKRLAAKKVMLEAKHKGRKGKKRT